MLSQGSRQAKRPALGSELEYKLLCPQARSGAVIGKARPCCKLHLWGLQIAQNSVGSNAPPAQERFCGAQGGNVIKGLRSKSGARIKVLEAADAAQERVILISSPAPANDDWAPAQIALFLAHACIVEAEGDAVTARVEVSLLAHSCVLHKQPQRCGRTVQRIRQPACKAGMTWLLLCACPQARLLVDKAHMGALMGKGGSVVAELRRTTGAQIKILSDPSQVSFLVHQLAAARCLQAPKAATISGLEHDTASQV